MMLSVGQNLFLFSFFFVSARSIQTQCDAEFSSKCSCGDMDYLGKVQYVVNCTNTNFQNASVLQNLPSKTQVSRCLGFITPYNFICDSKSHLPMGPNSVYKSGFN